MTLQHIEHCIEVSVIYSVGFTIVLNHRAPLARGDIPANCYLRNISTISKFPEILLKVTITP
jgi:hypothetical protein